MTMAPGGTCENSLGSMWRPHAMQWMCEPSCLCPAPLWSFFSRLVSRFSRFMAGQALSQLAQERSGGFVVGVLGQGLGEQHLRFARIAGFFRQCGQVVVGVGLHLGGRALVRAGL